MENVIVTFETRFCCIEALKRQSESIEFYKGDKIKIIFPKKLSSDIYGNVCYYLASCILSGWNNANAEMALDASLQRAKEELRSRGVRL